MSDRPSLASVTQAETHYQRDPRFEIQSGEALSFQLKSGLCSGSGSYQNAHLAYRAGTEAATFTPYANIEDLVPHSSALGFRKLVEECRRTIESCRCCETQQKPFPSLMQRECETRE